MERATDPAFFLGCGIHTCLGNGIEANLQGLRMNPEPPQPYLNTTTDEDLPIPYKLLGNSPLENSQQRLYELIYEVVEQALIEASLNPGQRRKMSLFLGSSSFDLGVWEARFKHELASSNDAVALRESSIALLADDLVGYLGIGGEDYSYNTACTASANALIAAVTQVEAGLIDHALVVAVELHNEVSALGFHGLGLLSSEVMRPFDRGRDGMVLGEGVSAIVVGKAPQADKQNFYLRGGANFSDPYSVTGASPDGSTMAAAMLWALDDAGLQASEIDSIKVHGTASLSNDEAEAAGMHSIFPTLPPLCALKPHIGHTLGACGLNELILFYRAVESGFLVATPGISANEGDLGITLNQQEVAVDSGNFMLNYFGFGGNNTSLIISNRERQS